MKNGDRYVPTVLLVEDEPVTREQLGELLESWPARIHLAENGEQGLALFAEIRPDIVVTDIVMPVMNGLDMARRIRRLDPKAKIVAITAYGETDDFKDQNEILADRYVLKPIVLETLLDALNRIRNTIVEEKGLVY